MTPFGYPMLPYLAGKVRESYLAAVEADRRFDAHREKAHSGTRADTSCRTCGRLCDAAMDADAERFRWASVLMLFIRGAR